MKQWGPITIESPAWLAEIADDSRFEAESDRMGFVIELARRNVAEATGGPFGAAVFESESGRLVAPGVNVVVPASTSFAHAEIMAIGIANQRLGTFDLGGDGLPSMELVASTEPCALCMGATVWSGVRRLITGATDADAREVGFDEGPKVPDWQAALDSRNITVETNVRRDEAAEVLQLYAASGAVIYNGRRNA